MGISIHKPVFHLITKKLTWFSSKMTSNISGGHWASFSAATICTFKFRLCDLPLDLIKRWSTLFGVETCVNARSICT
jgi:hypothetical protein